MFEAIQRSLRYAAAHDADGPTRVRHARWFLKHMKAAQTKEKVALYYGPGSDLVYFRPKNVTDMPSKAALNDIGRQMTAECQRVGWTPNVPDPAFPDVLAG